MAVDGDDAVPFAHPAKDIALGIDLDLVKVQFFHFFRDAVDDTFFFAAFRRNGDHIPQKRGHSRTVILGCLFDCIKIHVKPPV